MFWNPSPTPCECELPGQFNSGVPGILADVTCGRVREGGHVERCDICQRYDSDEAARAKLAEMGLADAVQLTDHCIDYLLNQEWNRELITFMIVKLDSIAHSNNSERTEEYSEDGHRHCQQTAEKALLYTYWVMKTAESGKNLSVSIEQERRKHKDKDL